MKKLTNQHMAEYWMKRVKHLQRMRPIESVEASAKAEACEAEANTLQAELDGLPEQIEDSLVVPGSRMRDRINAQVVGILREELFGCEARILQLRLEAESLRTIAEQPIGQALRDSLAEAQQRADYYANMC